CGLEFLSYGGRADKLQATQDRPRYVQDSFRIQVRASADELRRAADVMAERLNQSKGPFTFLIPLRGWSSIDREGRPTYDPAANTAFAARLREQLNDKN